MDRREGRKRAREEEEAAPALAGRPWKVAAMEEAAAFEEVTSAAVVGGGEKEEEAASWQRPPGVFEFPWQKCRGGLGVPGGGGGSWELRDVFFRSLVDGRAAAIGVPGDRLFPPPSKRALFDDVDAWLAAAGEGEVDPVWRSVLEGRGPPHDANVSSRQEPRAHLPVSQLKTGARQQSLGDVAGNRDIDRELW